MNEIWKDIKDYEGLYQVSNLGRVMSLKYNHGDNKCILNGGKSRGYLTVLLYKGDRRKYLVHRLVAEAFLPNPDGLPCVNHKNEDKTDNRVENLEWCTYQYNNTYGNVLQKRSIKQINDTKKSKHVYQYTIDGEFLREWPSCMEIKRQTGFENTNISACCRSIKKSAYGFRWSYEPYL